MSENNQLQDFRSEQMMTGFNPIPKDDVPQIASLTIIYNGDITKYKNIIKPIFMRSEKGLYAGDKMIGRRKRPTPCRFYAWDYIVSYTKKGKLQGDIVK